MFGIPVPYEHLEISVNRDEINGEKVDYLFDEKESGVASGSGTSKMLVENNLSTVGPLAITITVKDEFKPIILTHYAIKSANDAEGRDPSAWALYA